MSAKKARKTKRVTICGKRWTLKLIPKTERRGHYGKCEHPEEINKTIEAEANHGDERVLNTLLHECLHAGVWALDEAVVTQWADDVSKILIDLGWKREQPQP